MIFRQQGVALIQVLLISAIISILAIRFSYTARDQVEMAGAFEQRIKATQELKSVQSKIIYTLLTQDNYQQATTVLPDSEAWNFYGKPFALNATTRVAIQDNNGLLSLQYMNDPLWNKVLQKVGFTEEQAKQKQGELKDWQDRDLDAWIIGNSEPASLSNGQPYRNQPMQLPQELDFFFAQQPQQLRIIKALVSPYPKTQFNPMNAPDLLLDLYFDQALAAQIIALRQENQLSRQQLEGMLGAYDSDIITLYRGNSLKITTQVTLGEVKLQETMEIKLQPKKRIPVLILARY